jgi:hypothetical protein
MTSALLLLLIKTLTLVPRTLFNKDISMASSSSPQVFQNSIGMRQKKYIHGTILDIWYICAHKLLSTGLSCPVSSSWDFSVPIHANNCLIHCAKDSFLSWTAQRYCLHSLSLSLCKFCIVLFTRSSGLFQHLSKAAHFAVGNLARQ